jgi:hypothetical protein
VKLLQVGPKERDVDILVGTHVWRPIQSSSALPPHHPPGRMEAAHEARTPGRIEVLPPPKVSVVQADHNKLKNAKRSTLSAGSYSPECVEVEFSEP